MNQGKSNVVKQDMAIIGISEIKGIGMGIFNSDDHYIYYWGRRWRSSIWSAKKKKKDPKLTLAQIISFLIAKFRLKLKKVNKSLMIIQWRG